MKTARETAWDVHVTLFGYAPGENVRDTTTMDFLAAAIEARDRETVEACAKVACPDTRMENDTCVDAAARIRSLSPKETT